MNSQGLSMTVARLDPPRSHLLDPRSVGLGGFAGEIERDRALAHVYRSVGILRWLANCNGTSGREIICSGSLRPIANSRGSCTPDVSPFADSLSWIRKRQCFRVLASVMLTEAVLKNRLGLILGIEEHGRDADWFAIANLSAELLQEILETTPHVVRAYLTDSDIRRVSAGFALDQRSRLVENLRS